MKDCLMSLKIRKNKSPIIITLLLILALLTGLTAGYFSTHGITENGKFEAFSGKVFQNEVSGSTLTLHYTLAHPEKQGIRRKKASLGTVPTDMKNTYQICSQYEKKLKSFRYSRLSTENQLTLDSMLLYYHTEKSLGDNYLLQEPLGPSLSFRFFWRNMPFMKIVISPTISLFSPPSAHTFGASWNLRKRNPKQVSL